MTRARGRSWRDGLPILVAVVAASCFACAAAAILHDAGEPPPPPPPAMATTPEPVARPAPRIPRIRDRAAPEVAAAPESHSPCGGEPIGVLGCVLDEWGRGAPGVTVRLGDRSIVTDRYGWYRAPDAAPGVHALVVEAPGRLPVTREVKSGFTAYPVRLEVRRSIEGRVVDAQGGAVAGAEVRAMRGGLHFGRAARTGDDGRFVVEDVSDDTYSVRAVPDVASEKPLLPAVANRVDGGKTGLVVVVAQGERLRGRVVDETGAAVKDARVEVRPALRSWQLIAASVVAEDGTFAFVLPPGTRCSLDVRVPTGDVEGRPFAPAAVADVVPGGPPLKIALAHGGELAGEVVSLCGADASGLSLLAVPMRQLRAAPVRAKTDRFGRFRIAGLTGASYEVRLETPGGSSPVALLRGRELVAGAADVRLELVEAAAATGRLFDAAGSPAAKRGLTLVHEDNGFSAELRTDAAGRFRAPAVPRGTYAVTTRMQDETGRVVTASLGRVTAGGDGPTLYLPRRR